MKRNLTIAKEKSSAVDVEIQQYTSNVESLGDEKLRDKSILDGRARLVGPLINVLEEQLKFQAESVKCKRKSTLSQKSEDEHC